MTMRSLILTLICRLIIILREGEMPKLVLYSAVQTELITLAEAKLAIKLDSTSFADNISESVSVADGYHAITATATGSAITVAGKKTLFLLEPVSLSAGGTLNVKLQESVDNATFSDAGIAFTQVTTANDTTIQEKEYTGTYAYVRPAYSIVSAQASFSIKCIQSEATSIEDSYISDLISAAREYAEEFLTRAIGEQKWKLVLDGFPSDDYIDLPFAPLVSVSSVTYIDAAGTSATMSASYSNGYIVDTADEPGRVFLAYGSTWPSTTLLPYNGVEIIYTCGYTTSTLSKKVKDAMLKMIGAMYAARESGISDDDLRAIDNILRGSRLINHG